MQKKILVVDDDPDIVLMLTDRLEALGYATLAAGDGQRALELLESEEPGLVLLDLQMPRMTGLEVLEQLANQEQAASQPRGATEQAILANRPPIIVMTAHGTIQSSRGSHEIWSC